MPIKNTTFSGVVQARSVGLTTSRNQVTSPFDGAVKAKFDPPYLDYNNALDRPKIDALLAAVREAAKIRRQKWEMTHADFPQNNLIETAVSFGNKTNDGAVTITTSEDTTKFPPKQLSQRISSAKTAAKDALYLTPTAVSTGWLCSFSIDGLLTPDLSSGSYQVWSQTWWFECGGKTIYLGNAITNHFQATLDKATYFPLVPNNGSAQFFIRTAIETSKGTINVSSNVVPIGFTNNSCIGLQSVSLYGEDVPCSFKGGDHGARPKIEVFLSHPAGPFGQTVNLSYDDPHQLSVVTWFLNSFVIPAGDQSGQFEGFLGTRSVSSQKTISVTASVNGQSSSPLTIDVKKN